MSSSVPDHYRAQVCIGDLFKHKVRISYEPHLDNETYLEACVKDGPDELTLCMEDRGGQKASFDTSTIEEDSWKALLVDAGRIASRQAIYKEVTVLDMTAMSEALSGVARKLEQKMGARAKSISKLHLREREEQSFFH